MECRIVSSKNSAVFVSAERCLLFYYAYVVIPKYEYSYCIFLPWYKQISYVKYSSNKAALNFSCFLAIHKNISFPVYSIEIQKNPFPFKRCGYIKFIPVPEIRIKE